MSAAQERFARAVRALGHAGVGHVADDDQLGDLAARVEALVAEVEQQPSRERSAVAWFRGFFPDDIADGQELVHFADCPVCGPANPLGMGLRTHVDGSEVAGTVTLGPAHQGAPGRAHGGIVAALFDDALGYLLTVHGIPAYTRELTVRYDHGVPVGVPIHFRSRVVSRDGRRTTIEGEVTAADRVVATSRGVFVEPRREEVAAIRAAAADPSTS